MSTKSKGGYGEDIAINYLIEKKYIILERNFFCKFGELDIIAFKDEEYKFVEVKYRQKESSISMLELLSDQKVRRIKKTATVWLSMKGRNIYSTRFAFDFISILESQGDRKISFYENIFSL